MVDGFETYHVMNPYDDGIGLDEYVDWLIDAGYRGEVKVALINLGRQPVTLQRGERLALRGTEPEDQAPADEKAAEGDGNERVMLSPETVMQMDAGGTGKNLLYLEERDRLRDQPGGRDGVLSARPARPGSRSP